MQKSIKESSLMLFYRIRLLFESVKVVNNVAYGNEFVHFFFLNINAEFLLATKDELCKLDGIDSEVARKLSVESDLGLVNLEFVDKQFFELFEHNESLQISIADFSAKLYIQYYTLFERICQYKICK